MPADRPINLNKARKARARVKKRAQADENAVKFGRTRSQRQADDARTAAARARLDQHRRDTGDDTE
ncbi:DUF4169 family protein [Psychromarinibacter sp. C21-152]|uniref:DUF4169 family protein n=1 Tax=Psychromarinibacter sediminicola TaxID=3033385 RepID=A0AAE3TAX0_9RHOB|nr:DUF4169 family protein [Psychromarinibacter sediminicola]MDF0602035.1 DUF4169 family protein [Psychromarinibacter sediminicola]